MRTYCFGKTKMAGVLYLFLVVFLIFGIYRPAAAVTALAFKAENGEVIRDICTGRYDGAYLLTSQRILCLSTGPDGDIVANEIGSNSLDLAVLCSTDDGLFGITTTNQFYEYQNSSWSRIGALQAEYSTTNENDATVSIRNIVAFGKAVYGILYDYTTEQYQCLVIQRNERTCWVIPDIQPRSFCVWEEDYLIFDTFAQDNQSAFLLYDTVLKTSKQLSLQEKPDECTAMAYDPISDTLFAATSDYIAYSQARNSFIKGINLKYAEGLACFAGSSVLAWSGTSVYQCTVMDEAELNELCVMGVSTRFDNDFTAATGISVRNSGNMGMDVMEHISFALSSHDATVDIYGLLTRDGLQRIKEKGMYIDLGQSQVLSAMITELYPSLSAALYEQDKIVAWPLDVQPLCRMQDDALLQQYGITPPETFDDLLDIIPEVLDSGMIADYDMRLFDTMAYTKKSFIDYLIRQYIFYQQKIGEEINFDSTLFRHLAQRILAEIPKEDPLPEATGAEMPLFILSAVSPVIQDKLLTPLKLSSDTMPAIETWMYVAIINPYSKHKEQALRYLEFIAQQKDEYSYSYYQSMMEPYESPYALDEIAKLTDSLNREKERAVEAADEKEQAEIIKQLEAQIILAQENRYLVGQTAIQHYHQLAQMFVISEDSLIQYDNSMDSLIDQLIAGRFTLDGFIQACNQHVAMIYAENNVR